MVVALRFSPPVCLSPCSPAFRPAASRANPLHLNILHVSTFATKILRGVMWPRSTGFKDLPGSTTRSGAKLAQFAQLSHVLSIFYTQLLSIQRFCTCLRAKLMIPKDHIGRGIYPICRSVIEVASSTRANRLSSARTRLTSAFRLLPSEFAALTPLLSRFCPQPLSIQRFCSCSPANPMIPKDHGEGVYTHLGNQPVRLGDGKRSSITCMIRSAKMTASWMAQCNAGDGLVLSS